MIEVAKFLKKEYYPKYSGCDPDMIPEEGLLVKALDLHKEKVIVIHRGEEIIGAAVFLTLTDETIAHIEQIDINNVHILASLLQEEGDNIHFILVAGFGVSHILEGIRQAKKRKPKSISWFNPEQTHLHNYRFNHN